MNDMNGTPIEAGDMVVYAGRRRSNVWLQEGRVESVNGDKLRVLKSSGVVVTLSTTHALRVIGKGTRG